MANCGECKLKFSKISNLRSHVKRKHPEKIDTLAPKAVKRVGDHICKKCNETFSNFGNLRVHIKRKHPLQLEELAPIKRKVFKCKFCGSEFNSLKQCTVHKRVHAVVKTLKCPLCYQRYDSKDNIIRHYNEDHLINIDTETLELSSFNDFLAWKARVEKDTFSSYINLHGSGKNPNIKKILYVCHRSGDTRRRGSNIRSLKAQGSNKINGYCPAHINVIGQGSKCMITFCKTHVGHRQAEDIGHLFLAESDRQKVAAKIAAKIPFQTILDEIKDSVSNCHLERIHLLTKKDLYNIKNSYNLNNTSIIQHKNDTVSVDEWVNELAATDSVVDSVSNPNKNENQILLEEQQKLLASFEQQILGTRSLEEIELIKNIIAPIKPTLEAIRNRSSHLLNTAQNFPNNKKIEPQRRLLFTTKKKAKEESANSAHDRRRKCFGSSVIIIK